MGAHVLALQEAEDEANWVGEVRPRRVPAEQPATPQPETEEQPS